MGDLQIAPTRHTQVVVIGGGISGVWVALRLAYVGAHRVGGLPWGRRKKRKVPQKSRLQSKASTSRGSKDPGGYC